MTSNEILTYRNKELKQENKELTQILTKTYEGIDKLEKHPEYTKAFKFLMSHLPVTECP